MAKLTNSGVRFIVGVLSIAVTGVVVGSIIASAMNTLAEAIRESGQASSASSSSSSSSSSSIASSSSNPSSSSISSSSNTSNPVVELDVFTVEFNSMGGTPSNIASIEVTENDTIFDFPTVTLANNTFAGWYTGNTPSDVLFTATMPVVRDMVLYATWTANPAPVLPPPGAVTHVVAFDAAGGSPVTSIQVESGKTFTLPGTTRTGYVFLGWFTGNLPGDELFTASTTVTRDLTLLARWERQSYQITFLTYGGSAVEPLVAKADETIDAPLSPTKLNASFEGWYLDAEFTEAYTFTVMPEASFTLHALWGDVATDGLLYAFIGDAYIVRGYEGVHNVIMIPSEYNEFPVTEIADYAFESNNTLVSVVLPEGSNIHTIGKGAFNNMPLLREVVLGPSVTTIRDDAFRNATALRELHIPAEVTRLGTNVLTGAESIRRVTVQPANNALGAVSGIPNFKYLFGGITFNTPANLPIPASLQTVAITEGATAVPTDFFRDLPNITEASIPASVTSVGFNVLFGATNLRTLRWTFTSTTQSTNGQNAYLSYAFGANYTTITNVPAGLSSVIINETASTRIPNGAFYNIGSLTSIELPQNITAIGDSVFAHLAINTSRLQYIELPENLVSIDFSAFFRNTSLLELYLPDSVTTIGTNVISETLSLRKLSFNHDSLPVNSRFFRYLYGGTSAIAGGTGATGITLNQVEVRGTPTSLIANFFRSFTSIETVFIPSTITSMGDGAFSFMTNLKQVQVINQDAELNKVILPSGLTSIGTNLFQSSTSIQEVIFPVGITAIPAQTFVDATSLKAVTLSSGLLTIGNEAFLRTGLESINLPNTVTTLGNFAFSSTRLVTLTIPSSVTTIGTNLIASTNTLVTLNFNVDSLPTAGKFFRYFYGGGAFNSGGILPTTPTFALTTVNVTGGTALPNNFFNMGSAFPILKTITLANTFTTIGESAFSNLTGLTSLTLEEGITSIGVFAFFNTTSLLALTIPSTVTTIGNNAFQQAGMATLVLGANLTTLGSNVFVAMPNLTSIEFLGAVPPAIGTTIFATAINGLTLLPNLIVEIPFGSTTAYTTVVTTPVNNNYAQFVALSTATPTRLVEAEDPNLDPAGE
jgi:uncharacterized repeat protein (TIGR02543 family)